MARPSFEYNSARLLLRFESAEGAAHGPVDVPLTKAWCAVLDVLARHQGRRLESVDIVGALGRPQRLKSSYGSKRIGDVKKRIIEHLPAGVDGAAEANALFGTGPGKPRGYSLYCSFASGPAGESWNAPVKATQAIAAAGAVTRLRPATGRAVTDATGRGRTLTPTAPTPAPTISPELAAAERKYWTDTSRALVCKEAPAGALVPMPLAKLPAGLPFWYQGRTWESSSQESVVKDLAAHGRRPIAIIGPVGCGKTSTLHSMARLASIGHAAVVFMVSAADIGAAGIVAALERDWCKKAFPGAAPSFAPQVEQVLAQGAWLFVDDWDEALHPPGSLPPDVRLVVACREGVWRLRPRGGVEFEALSLAPAPDFGDRLVDAHVKSNGYASRMPGWDRVVLLADDAFASSPLALTVMCRATKLSSRARGMLIRGVLDAQFELAGASVDGFTARSLERGLTIVAHALLERDHLAVDIPSGAKSYVFTPWTTPAADAGWLRWLPDGQPTFGNRTLRNYFVATGVKDLAALLDRCILPGLQGPAVGRQADDREIFELRLGIATDRERRAILKRLAKSGRLKESAHAWLVLMMGEFRS